MASRPVPPGLPLAAALAALLVLASPALAQHACTALPAGHACLMDDHEGPVPGGSDEATTLADAAAGAGAPGAQASAWGLARQGTGLREHPDGTVHQGHTLADGGVVVTAGPLGVAAGGTLAQTWSEQPATGGSDRMLRADAFASVRAVGSPDALFVGMAQQRDFGGPCATWGYFYYSDLGYLGTPDLGCPAEVPPLPPLPGTPGGAEVPPLPPL